MITLSRLRFPILIMWHSMFYVVRGKARAPASLLDQFQVAAQHLDNIYMETSCRSVLAEGICTEIRNRRQRTVSYSSPFSAASFSSKCMNDVTKEQSRRFLHDTARSFLSSTLLA